MTELAIIIPVYNNAKNLNKLILSIRKQLKKIKNYKLIFVEDCSTDDSRDILGKIIYKSKNLILIKNKSNLGQLGSILTGINSIRSKYYYVMAADGQDDPNLIIKFLKEIKKNKFEIILFCKSNLHGSLFRKFFAYIHWKLLSIITMGNYPKYGSDVFGFTELTKKKVVEFLDNKSAFQTELIESDLPKKYIYFVKKERTLGKSSQKLSDLLNMHFKSLFSLNSIGLKLIWISTILTVISFFLFSFYILIDFFISAQKVYTGWRSIVLINLIGFSLIFIHLGYQTQLLKKITNKLNNLNK